MDFWISVYFTHTHTHTVNTRWKRLILTSGRGLTFPVMKQWRVRPLPTHQGVPRGHRVYAGQKTMLEHKRHSYITLLFLNCHCVPPHQSISLRVHLDQVQVHFTVFFICFGTIFTSKVYIFKTFSANITTDHQKCTFFKHFMICISFCSV